MDNTYDQSVVNNNDIKVVTFLDDESVEDFASSFKNQLALPKPLNTKNDPEMSYRNSNKIVLDS